MTVSMNIRKKKIDFCVKLLHKAKQDYFDNIDIKMCQWYKKISKRIKTFFRNLISDKIFSYDKGRLIKDPFAVATTMNCYFANITQTIGLKWFQFDHAINLLEDHTSIISVKSNLDYVSDKFDFKKVHGKEMKREIMNLNNIYISINISNKPRCFTSQNS